MTAMWVISFSFIKFTYCFILISNIVYIVYIYIEDSGIFSDLIFLEARNHDVNKYLLE